jgi:LTXXQ motif family protein
MSMLLYVPPRHAIYCESFPLVLEVLMLKTVAAGLTALFVTASSLAYAQAPSTPASQQENARPSAADLNALTDARIGIVKAALQLTPEQAKYWPAVEEAIRDRAMGRQVRLAAAARLRDQGDGDPIDMVRHRADALAQRAAELKQLADAWQPLAATLTPEQKQRLRFFAVNILRLVPRAVELRRMEAEDEGDED